MRTPCGLEWARVQLHLHWEVWLHKNCCKDFRGWGWGFDFLHVPIVWTWGFYRRKKRQSGPWSVAAVSAQALSVLCKKQFQHVARELRTCKKLESAIKLLQRLHLREFLAYLCLRDLQVRWQVDSKRSLASNCLNFAILIASTVSHPLGHLARVTRKRFPWCYHLRTA